MIIWQIVRLIVGISTLSYVSVRIHEEKLDWMVLVDFIIGVYMISRFVLELM